MTGRGLQRVLDSMGFSQRRLAKELEINERTMRRYCSGASKIPKVVELAVMHVHYWNTKNDTSE